MKFSAQTQLFSHVSFMDKLLFTKHISIMLKSGVTLLEAIDIILSQTKSEAFKKILLTISSDIKNGKSFKEALAKHVKVFDAFYISIVEIGESSGTLDDSLNYLAKQLGKEYALRKKIRGASLYPLIVLTAAAAVGIALSIFVLPKLLDLFKDFDTELPLATKILLWFASLMQNYGIFVGIGCVAIFIGVRFLLKMPRIQPLWQNSILSIPLLGTIIQNAELASFCRNIGVMIQSGQPITTALAVESEVLSNVIFKRYAKQMLGAVEKGQSLSHELTTNKYKKFPLIAAKMIAVGEETGKLDETLLYLADFFEDDVDDAAKNISTILEPVLLLLIGGVVAFVALAIISPIYQLSTGLHK